MVALNADDRRTFHDGDLLSYPVAAGEIIFLSALVNLNDSGFAVAATNTAAETFAGVSTDTVADNSDGADGAIDVLIRRVGIHRFTSDVALDPNSDYRSIVYVVDDNTITTVKANHRCGIVAKVISASEAWIDIGAAFADSTAGPIGATGAKGDDASPIHSFVIENPSALEEGFEVAINLAFTAAKIRARLRGSTSPSVQWELRHGPDPSLPGSLIHTATTTNVTTGDIIVPTGSLNVLADDWIWIKFLATIGTVNQFALSLFE